MKIKKIFGLVTVASLAVLMTACGKSTKNESIIDDDVISMSSISMADFKASMNAKTVEKICSGVTYIDNDNELYIAKDDSKYYVYNFNMENKLVLTLEDTDIDDIVIGNHAFVVIYDANADGDTGYALYLPNGKCLVEKTYVTDSDINKAGKNEISMGFFSEVEYTKYRFSYTVRVKVDGEPDQFETTVSDYYYVEVSSYEGESTTYLDENDFYEQYGKLKEEIIDGKAVGLDGYTIKSAEDDKVYLFKKDKVVNVMDMPSGIISDGYALYQIKNKVTAKDDYDVFIDDTYYVVDTYKINLKDSKITKLKNFKYYIVPSIHTSPVLSKDKEEIVGYNVYVYDYSNKKLVTSADKKVAVVKGNGNIKLQEALTPTLKAVVQDGEKYYSYDTTNEVTTVFDVNGKILEVYQGIYYDDVLVQKSSTTYTFFDKNGKTLFVLYGGSGRINLSKYVGYDMLGKQVLVTISNGAITTTDVSDYDYDDTGFFVKENSDSTGISYYSFDSTLTDLELTFNYVDDVDDIYSYDNCYYYEIEDGNTGERSLVCFK